MSVVQEKRVLFVRHLPACLSPNEKREMLKHFGASDVRVMPIRGRLKHTAFATFEDNGAARKAIERLHQVEILDCILSVEFAKEPQINLADTEQSVLQATREIHEEKGNDTITSVFSSNEEKLKSIYVDKLPPVAPHFGLKYPTNPGLKYKYPPPNADILINICSALLTVPRLYTQVLHLMNKLNLVPPFNPATTVPPMVVEHIRKLCNFSYIADDDKLRENNELQQEPDKFDVIEMSESESEYESSEENDGKTKSMDMNVPERVLRVRKRRKKKSLQGVERKKQKLKDLVSVSVKLKPSSNETIDRSEAFEETTIGLTKKPIDIKVPLGLKNPTEDLAIVPEVEIMNETIEEKNPVSVLEIDKAQGFGKLAPIKSADNDDADTPDDTEETVLKDYITKRQLESGRLSKKEMSNSSLYKKYQRGEPTCRLYIKNLSKQVTEKDLKFIFGRFVNFNDENERNMFDVRVMTQGRMKGQAFVGMPAIEAATRALNSTNGYQLINKPMVVHFARSAKPK